MNDIATPPGTDLKSRAYAFAQDPTHYFNYSYTEMQMIPREELEQLQLAAMQLRFEQLYASIPMVKKLADKQHFGGIGSLTDVVPMLFEHTMYKSYPPSLLENNRFDQLTKWLDKLTAFDLSNFDATGIESITDWIKKLDETTPLRVNHSSGTTGTMSFNPFSWEEYQMYGKSYAITFLQELGDPPASADNYIPNMHVLAPTFRHGGNGFVRSIDFLRDYIAGGEERVHALYPGRLDSDVLYLAARIRAAKVKGTLDQLKISPYLLSKQKEFEAQQARMAQDMEDFFKNAVQKLAGERVFMNTTWNMIHDLAKDGLARGLRQVFDPRTVIISGGGAKGMVQPEGWENTVCEFAGVKRMRGAYGMSELCSPNIQCEHGHFHFAPWLVVYLLDPDTSELLPRTGVVTGRASFYDLMIRHRWGGFISGDEITVHWEGDCPCGAASAYMERKVERYSEKRGGDDKISCAATPSAHREAMDFLVKFESK